MGFVWLLDVVLAIFDGGELTNRTKWYPSVSFGGCVAKLLLAKLFIGCWISTHLRVASSITRRRPLINYFEAILWASHLHEHEQICNINCETNWTPHCHLNFASILRHHNRICQDAMCADFEIHACACRWWIFSTWINEFCLRFTYFKLKFSWIIIQNV